MSQLEVLRLNLNEFTGTFPSELVNFGGLTELALGDD
jgi:hypothetical protein